MRMIRWRVRRRGVLLAVAALVAGSGLLATAAFSATPADQTIGCAPDTTVQTTNGPVCGIVVGGVREWLGIPYAAPPVADLRWAPPQPPTPWSSTLQATAFGNACQQGRPNVQSSEDCLYLNVWQPPGGDHLPVMVHIHGGGFFGGSGNGDNTLLATTGHEVIVSMNYRLGIFGFLANATFGPHSGDYGLQDQQAALGWVQANIAAFGGDPHNVTIFGESAGGSSVCDQIASPTAAGLFQKAISTSGEYNTLFGVPEQAPRTPEDLEVQDCKSNLPTADEANRIGDQFAAAVGCGPGTPDVAACLRKLPVDVVEHAAYTPGDGYQYGGQGTIAPTLNGTTLPMTLRQALRTGHVNRVRVIAGVARDENLVGWPDTAAEFEQLVHAQYGPIAQQVLRLYPLERFYSPFVAWRTLAADSTAVCPALTTARALARRMPVYQYEVDDGNAPPESMTGQPAGSHHVADWFLTPTPGLDVNQQVLQAQELAAVTMFARTGNPTAPSVPNWPTFKLGQAGQVMSLAPGGDSQLMSVDQISAAHNCGFWDRVSPKP
jgi:para-nitrobenzyl esterase